MAVGEDQARLPKRIFVSYARADQEEVERIIKFAKPRERWGHLEIWWDQKIMWGDEWKEKISDALRKGDAALLFLTADFFSSEFIMNDELPLIMERAEREGLVVLPVLLSSCDWESARFIEAKNLYPTPPTTFRGAKTTGEFDALASGFIRLLARKLNLPDPRRVETGGGAQQTESPAGDTAGPRPGPPAPKRSRSRLYAIAAAAALVLVTVVSYVIFSGSAAETSEGTGFKDRYAAAKTLFDSEQFGDLAQRALPPEALLGQHSTDSLGQLFYWWGHSNLRQSEPEAAVQYLEHAFDLHDTNIVYCHDLILALSMAGDSTAACRLADQARTKWPESGMVANVIRMLDCQH
ncbi:TIR domain-containing protein [candidate division GN15 bacterium]|nr:TIR domain-containing protein [candidate division GN15 bacterium]